MGGTFMLFDNTALHEMASKAGRGSALARPKAINRVDTDHSRWSRAARALLPEGYTQALQFVV
jgi:hypothetical protein